MNKTFTLRFLIKKAKINANGTVPIYLRITINGEICEIASKRYISPEKWNSATQKVNGNSEDIKAINAYLKTLEQQVYDTHHQMLKDKAIITAETLKQKLYGAEERQRTLIPIFEDHNNKIEALIDVEYAPATIQRYKTLLKHTIAFLQWKYSISDIDIKKINHAFVTDFEFYFRSVRKCGNNATVKYIKYFGKIIRICIANGWLDKNPFINYKGRVKETDPIFLLDEEVERIVAKEFSIERLNRVKDIFLFCCFTSLAYIDVKRLSRSNIGIGIDGEKWIFIERQKTENPSHIPILPAAQKILDKYKDHPECLHKNCLLPVLSNQRLNSYLKEIADVCGINKKLTFHASRHTFGTTTTLNNGVPLETVNKMMGHKTLRTTQRYARVLPKKVSNDMKLLKEKLSSTISDEQQQKSIAG